MADIKLVQYLAELSKINLTAEELQELCGQLQEMLALVDCVKDAEVTAALPEGVGTYYSNLRLDTPAPPLPINQLLRNAGNTKEHFFAVPKVVQ